MFLLESPKKVNWIARVLLVLLLFGLTMADAPPLTASAKVPSADLLSRATAFTPVDSDKPVPRSASSAANAEEVELIGHIGGGSWTVAVGNSAYVGFGPELAVMSMANPINPRRVGYVVLRDFVVDVAVSGGYVYVADWSGLEVIDVRSSSNPQRVGHYETPGRAWGVAVAGGYAYVADAWKGLRVIDVRSPSDPQGVGYYDTPGAAKAVAVSGDYAYIADCDQGLRVIDVSDPTDPQEVGYYDTPGTAGGVTVAGSYAYIADGTMGLRVVDVSDPTEPQEVGACDTPGEAIGVVVTANGYVYVADDDGGLRVIDVFDPSDPKEVGAWGVTEHACDVVVAGGYAYLAAAREGLWVIDVVLPVDPQMVGHVPGAWFHGLAVASAGSFAYVADGDYGLRVIYVGDPANPHEWAICDTPGEALDVAVAGEYAYVADDNQGLRVVDVASPSNPHEVGYYDTPGEAKGVAVSGSYVYVADGTAGLRIVNVSDPSQPQEVGACDTPGEASGVAVAPTGGYACVADGDSGLRVIDVSDPTDPQEVGYYDTSGEANSVAAVDSYAYVADGTMGLRVVDVSVPSDPQEIGYYDTPGEAKDVTVVGVRAYMADEDGGLRMIDVSDPSDPEEFGYYDTPEGAGSVAVAGEWVYLVGRRDGFFILRYPGTKVGGPITSDTTWTVAQSPYVITSTIEVQEGVTLTIEPGVTVKFDRGKSLRINGTLIARGTAEEMIIFTSSQPVPRPGDWGNIEFTSTAVTTTYDSRGEYAGESVLQYCVVEYGGGNADGAIEPTSILVDHCTVQRNAATGIYARSTGDGPAKVAYNTISNNSGGGIYALGTAEAPAEITHNTISNNSGGGYGGGIYASYAMVLGNIVSENSFTNASSYGGGIYASCSTVSGNTIKGNVIGNGDLGARAYGGGISATSNSTVTGNIVRDNIAWGRGGGIYAEDSTVTNNTITSNSAFAGYKDSGAGGGVCAKNSTVTDNIINDNVTRGGDDYASYGGGISAGGGSTISDNTVSGNSARGGVLPSSYGGGIHASSSTVMGNTVTDNTAWKAGGGIYASRSMIVGNTVHDNLVSLHGDLAYDGPVGGGGIYATYGSSVLTNTVTQNSIGSGGRGAGVYLSDADTLVNTMEGNAVVANTGPSGSTVGGVGINGTPQVHDNNLYDNMPYDVVVVSSDDISGTLNYWGTTDSADILAQAYDCEDNGGRGCLLYTPFRSEPSPGAPFPQPPAPKELVADFREGQVALSWKSVPGFQTGWDYRVYYDTDSPAPPYNGVGLNEGHSPISVGSQTSCTVTGLACDVSYYLAVTVQDDTGHESCYSNVEQGEASGYVAFIPPSGGRLVASANDTTLIFPIGAVTGTIVISYTPQLPQPTGDLAGVYRFYSLTAVYSDTGQPAQLAPHASYTTVITYTYSSGAIEDTLGLYWRHGGEWSQEGITSTVNITDNLVTAQVDHLSLFAVLGETKRLYLPLVVKDY